MEKLKNIINPGGGKDDEILYGSGRTGDAASSGDASRSTGEGSHLAGAMSSGHHPGSHPTSTLDPTSRSTGPLSSDPAYQSGSRVGSDPSRTLGTAALAGGTGHDHPGHSGHYRQDPQAGDVNKPLPHTPTPMTGNEAIGATHGSLPDRTAPSGSTVYGAAAPVTGAGYPSSGPTSHTGPHSSSLGSKLDPRVDVEPDHSRTHGSSVPASGSTESSRHHGTGILGKLGLGGGDKTTSGHHSHHDGSGGAPSSTEPGSGYPSTMGGTSRGAPTSSIPGSGYPGTSGNTSLGAATSAIPGSGYSGTSGDGSHGVPASTMSGSDQPGIPRDTSLRTHLHTIHGPVAVGGPVSVEAPGYDGQHDHSHHSGGNVVPLGATAAAAGLMTGAGHRDPYDQSTGSTSSTAGPHNSGLLNKLDPRVTSGSEGSRMSGSVPGTAGNYDAGYAGDRPEPHTTGLMRGGEQIVGREPDYSRNQTGVGGTAVPAAGGYGPGEPVHHGTGVPSGYGAPPTTTGSHSLMDKLDPRTTSSQDPSRTTAPRDSHPGRDAALLGGTTAGAAAGYAAGRHHGDRDLPSYDPKDDVPHREGAAFGRDDTEGKGHGVLGFLHRDKDKDRSHEESRQYERPGEPERHDRQGGVLGMLHRDKDKDSGRYEEPRYTTTGTAEPERHDRKGGVLGMLSHDKDKSTTYEEPRYAERTTATERDDRKGGVLGLFSHDKDKDRPYEEPRYAERPERDDRKGGVLGVFSHDKDKDRPYEESRHHGRDVAPEKEERKGGVLGMFSHDKDKDRPYEEPRHHGRDAVPEKEERKGGVLGMFSHDKDKDRPYEETRHHERTTTQPDKDDRKGGVLGLFSSDKDKEKEKHHHEKAKEHDRHKDEKDDKHHGLLGGLLHHDKDKDKEREREVAGHHGPSYAATGAGTTTEYDDPKEPGVHHHGPTTIATDKDGHTRLHKDPPQDYVRQALAHKQPGEELEGDEQRRVEQNLPEGYVVEPHTGLPMNVGKYGSGQGGTDGGPVPGYHRH